MQARIVNGRDAETLNVLGIEYAVYTSGRETDGALTFAELRMPPGAAIPPHRHTREDEVFHVVEGQVAFTLAGRETTVGPGTTVFGPRGIPHACRTAGAGAARVLVTIAPAGLEAMFAELSRLPPGAPALARVAEIVGRYGISLV